jgi:dihydroorotate dehydrogenase
MFKSLLICGFGYVTLGTITINPREGNPKPRIWRHANDSLLNSMGLPNRGAREVRRKLAEEKRKSGIVVLSISGLSVEEFSNCYVELEQYADAIELNVSTPNTIGVRIFQEPKIFEQLLDRINQASKNMKPIWVKVPPYFDEKSRENVLELVNICVRKSVKGITAVNTKQVGEPRASNGIAGLSGRAIFNDMLRIVNDIYKHTQGKIPLNACGGIFSGADAWKAIQAGAATVQLYTGLVYNGPGIAASINRQLLRLLEDMHYSTISEVIGSK